MCIDTIAPLQPCISMATPPHASALVRLTFDSWCSGPVDCIHRYVVKIYFIFTRPTFLYVSYLQVSNPRLRQWSPSELRPACSKRQPTRLRRDPRPRQWRCITVHTLAGAATTAIYMQGPNLCFQSILQRGLSNSCASCPRQTVATSKPATTMQSRHQQPRIASTYWLLD